MRRSAAVLCSILTAASIPFSNGCAPADEEGDAQESDLRSCESVDVELEWVDKAPGVTAARIESLNDYAYEKMKARECELEETLARRGALTEDTIALSDAYVVEVGNEATCFNGSFIFANFDLETNKRYNAMREQVDMTVEFLKGIHEDTNGIPTVLFDKVVLCPKGPFGTEMEIAGPNLYIGLPFSQFGHISTFDARELRNDKWTVGEHLSQLPKAEFLQVVWPLLDPAGTARNAMRSGIAKRSVGLATKLAALKSGIAGGSIGASAARNQLAGLMNGEVSPTLMGADGEQPLVNFASAQIESASTEQLACIADRWGQFVSDPEKWTQTSEAGVAVLLEEASRNALNVNVKQEGTIVIGNTHWVNVDLDLFFSTGYQNLTRYVEIEQIQQNVQWEQKGFVVVYTIDDINVNVSLNVHNALQAAGMERALSQCR